MIRVPIVRPALGKAEQDAVARVIASGWITQGPEVAALETETAAALGAAHAVCVSNATVAIELCLRVAGVKRGDDVVTVSHSFIATANAVVAAGARPVFADIDADTYGMSPASLESAITDRTTAILCVHQIGIPCNIQAIMRIAKSRGIPVIEDAACAIGTAINVDGAWQRIGRPHGLFACFSFHPRKVVTTGDGGLITTNDETMATRFRLLRQHAMSIPDTVRHNSSQVVFEDYTEPAWNYRMTDLQAAVGRPQIARLDEIIAERRAIAKHYADALSAQTLFLVPKERPDARTNWQTYALRIRPNAPVSQREVLQYLVDHGVASKRGISNAHQEIAYRDRSTWACGQTPCAGCASGGRCERLLVSEDARDSTIMIPLFHGMTEAERDHVVTTVKTLAAKYA